MRKILLPVVVYFTSFVTACSDSSNEKETIVLPSDQQNQTVYADDTDRKISFTATAAWNTHIDYHPDSKATDTENWIQLDPPGGEAGEVTIKVTLSPNYSGSDRKATIHIICEGTRVTVIIEQKGQTSTGEIPVPQKKISRVEIRSIETWEENHTDNSELYTFTYDAKGRLIEQCYRINGEDETIHRLEYGTTGEVRITEKENSEYWLVGLDEKGYASRLEVKESYGGYDDCIYTFAYDADHYLKEESWSSYDQMHRIVYAWKNGNFSYSLYDHSPEQEEGEGDDTVMPDLPKHNGRGRTADTWRDTLTEHYTYLTTAENHALNLDPNLFISTLGGKNGSANSDSYHTRKGRMDLLALWGFLGKRSRNHVNGPSAFENLAFPVKPDEAYYHTYEYTCQPLHYEFDEAGYLQSITDKIDKKIYKVITATQEKVFIKETTDRITYTFTYKN